MDNKQGDKEYRIPIIEFVIPMYYILAQYKIGNISVGILLLIVTCAIHILMKKSIYIFKPLLFLIVCMIFHDILKMLFIPEYSVLFFNYWIEKILFIVFIFITINHVNEEKLYNIWRSFGIIAILGMLYHSILVYLLDMKVSMIKILPFNFSNGGLIDTYSRPHSFFLEPASYVTWILPLLYMSLKKGKIIFSIVITISVLLSTSTTGVILCFCLWIYFILLAPSAKKYNKIFLTLFFLAIVVIFTNLSIFNKTIDKYNNTDISNNLRITSGLKIYADSKVTYKLFGIPYNSTEDYFRSGEIELSNYGMVENASWLGFVNTISRMLLMYGIIGGLLYLRLFFIMYKYNDKSIRPYLLVCFISLFGQGAFLNSVFVIQFAILLSLSKASNKKLYKRLIVQLR